MKKELIIMILIAVLIAIVLGLCGCDCKNEHNQLPNQLPTNFNILSRPVVIVACNEGGLVVMDGEYDIYVWDSSNYYFVAPFTKSDLKKGDVLLPEKTIKPEKE